MEIKESETEVKEIEEFLKTAETQKGKKQKTGRGEFAGKIKQFLPAVVVILLAIILFAALMSQGAKVSSLESEVTALKSKINANEITELKSHVAALPLHAGSSRQDCIGRGRNSVRLLCDTNSPLQHSFVACLLLPCHTFLQEPLARMESPLQQLCASTLLPPVHFWSRRGH